MTYLIFNEYINHQVKNLDLRNESLEELTIRTTDFSYEIGQFVNVETINNKVNIANRVETPDNYLSYYKQGKRTNEELKLEVTSYVNKITNQNYQMILQELILASTDFFLFPAAKSIHHAFIGGLAEHTLSMLKLADTFIANYQVNQDLLYAGIILHDYGKIRELKEYGLTYSIEGNLLGHIVICVEEIANIAITLGLNQQTDIVALKHLILSHHGKLEYGSPKEPAMIEAYLVSVLDEVDAKLNLLTNVLSPLEPGKLSAPLMAMERRRFLKLD